MISPTLTQKPSGQKNEERPSSCVQIGGYAIDNYGKHCDEKQSDSTREVILIGVHPTFYSGPDLYDYCHRTIYNQFHQ